MKIMAGELVSVVDDDESVREALPDLLRELGFSAEAFSSAEQFIASGAVDRSSCLILDIAMSGMSGPELRLELKRRGKMVPSIFITATMDAGVRLRMLKEGAVECLFKPFSDTALLAAINKAIE
jgi:FixJ family two-component response regulator